MYMNAEIATSLMSTSAASYLSYKLNTLKREPLNLADNPPSSVSLKKKPSTTNAIETMAKRPPRSIVILGGSFAGLSTAHGLLRKTFNELQSIDKELKYRVILISPSTHFYWNPGAPRAICSSNILQDKAAFVPFLDEFKQYADDQFQFIQGEATAVNFRERYVSITRKCSETDQSQSNLDGIQELNQTPEEYIDFHALVVATGTSAHSPLFSLHGSHERTVLALEEFQSQLKLALRIFIIGGGLSAVECAAQIAAVTNRETLSSLRVKLVDRWESLARKMRLAIRRPSVAELREEYIAWFEQPDWYETENFPNGRRRRRPTIVVISRTLRLLPKLDLQEGLKAERLLQSMGVFLRHGVSLVSTKELPYGRTQCELLDVPNNRSGPLSADMIISATGVTPNTAFLPQELVNATGYLIVDQQVLRVPGAGDRVYGIGGCTNFEDISLEDLDRSVPVLLKNLRNDLLKWELVGRWKKPPEWAQDQLQKFQVEDLELKQHVKVPRLSPISRQDGFGRFFGHRLPARVTWMLSGRKYDFAKARKVAKGNGVC
jgi:NADH dehydrogenase FAD-containing subunit